MSITAAEGFVAAGCHAGIKRRKFDMAMIATDDLRPVPCAAVFTQNKFAAPPVELDRATLKANGGMAAAVIVNSGNANAGTGVPGYKNAQLMAAATGEALQIANSMCWFARPGSSVRRCRWTPSSRDAQAGEEIVHRRRARCCAGDPHHRSPAQGGGDQGLQLHARRHGQGLRHDRAEHGDHARLPDDRCRRAALA